MRVIRKWEAIVVDNHGQVAAGVPADRDLNMAGLTFLESVLDRVRRQFIYH